MNTYDKGDVLRVYGTYTDIAGTPTDPGVPMFSMKTPSGITTTYTYPTDTQIVRSAAGLYYVDVTLNAPGQWMVRHHSAVSGIASAEREYFVKQSAFP